MSGDARVRAARNVIVSTWERRLDPMADLATEAAQALEDAGLLRSPQAAESDGGQKPEGYVVALPWARLMDSEDLGAFLDGLASAAIANTSPEEALAEVEAVCGTWRVIAEAQHAHNTALGPDVALALSADDLPEPYACRHCDISERGHAQRWTPDAGSHAWTPPSDKQIVARMLARRAAREGER
ncbi:hypothetical protein [Streptomyces abikoensis]|uniref:hypothetical protein n=1 Tax=Streptomyces abikoensis TaxID=97398 RepID=UPI00167257D0|nr:hypothetical protein [Streptomyces abikoensis]GGP55522.1 hypothetical protein GCM10010214_30890 [Streptomyces abikoensis]